MRIEVDGWVTVLPVFFFFLLWPLVKESKGERYVRFDCSVSGESEISPC